jgi:hypothetical protein
MMILRSMIALAMLALPHLSSAQQPRAQLPEPASRSQLRDMLNSSDPLQQAGSFTAAVAILTREKSVPGLSAEDVAAELVSVASSSGPPRQAQTSAVSALIRSTQHDKANPYRGAADRLAEVYRLSPDVGIRGLALAAVARYATPAKALAFLVPIAEHGDARAPILHGGAINGIAELNTDQSVAFLRELDERGVVTHQWSLSELKRHAANGYRARPSADRRPPR